MLARAVTRPGFARDTAVLIAGTAGAQGLNLLASPVLTRLYRPDQLGTLGLLISVSSVITPLACWRYEQAIMLEQTDETAAQLVHLSLLITGAVALLSLSIVGPFGQSLATALGHPGAGPWLWVVPVLIVLVGVYQTLRMWLGRTRDFTSIAGARLSRTAATNVAQIGVVGALGPSDLALSGCYLLGTALEVVMLVVATVRSTGARLRVRVSVRGLLAIARRHRKFPLFAVPGTLSNLLAVEGPTLLLAVFFSPAEVGLYWLSYRIMVLPVSLVGDAVSTVFYQRMAALRPDSNQRAAITVRVFVGLFAVALVPMALMLIFGPALFSIVFGPDWEMAGEFARALVPAKLLLFAVFPLTQAFFIYEKQEIGLIWNTTFLVVSVGSFAAGAALAGPLGAVQGYSLGCTLMYGMVAVFAFVWSGGSLQHLGSYLAIGSGRAQPNPTGAVDP